MKNIKSFQLPWLNILRGIAILMVFLVHFIERFLPGAYFGNPGIDWPSVSSRFNQLLPLIGEGNGWYFANILRYIGWLGDQGVQLFFIASGFGLTYSYIKKGYKIDYVSFLKNKLGKIFPQWWILHAIFIFTYLILGIGLNPSSFNTLLSFFGVRILPETMYYFCPSWWFISPIMQFYIFFPFISRIIKKPNAIKNIFLLCLFAILIRLAGLFVFDDLLDWWSRGSIFITRLPEILFGVLFAYIILECTELVKKQNSVKYFILWFFVWTVGNLVSFTLWGMSIAFLLTGAGLFMMIFIVSNKATSRRLVSVQWVGKNSLSFFLVHHIVLRYTVPSKLLPNHLIQVVLFLIGSLVLSIIISILLNIFTKWIVKVSIRIKNKFGYKGLISRYILFFILITCVMVSIELFVRIISPQEILGWGERKSLMPDDTVGYKLIPGEKTRLRWRSYDYVVTSNSLGFPGPLYDSKNSENNYRIFVTGDAFESSEGVNTKDSWPRLTENILNSYNLKTEILNFSISGWGPQHYERVISEYVPQYNPDLIIVGFFMNEFADVHISDIEYYNSIGFDNPSQSGLYSLLTFQHLRANCRRIIKDLSGSRKEITFPFADTSKIDEYLNASELIKEHMIGIKETAIEFGCEILILLIPNSTQVCGFQNEHLNKDSLNINQPQEVAQNLFDSIGLTTFNLMQVLIEAEGHPYQSKNIHWTEYGHEIVAEAVAERVRLMISEKDVPNLY